MGRIKGGDDGPGSHVVSPDGELLARIDNYTGVCGIEITGLQKFGSAVTLKSNNKMKFRSLGFAKNGTFVIANDYDDLAHVWKSSSWEELTSWKFNYTVEECKASEFGHSLFAFVPEQKSFVVYVEDDTKYEANGTILKQIRKYKIDSIDTAGQIQWKELTAAINVERRNSMYAFSTASENENILAFLDDSRDIKIWDTAQDKLLSSFPVDSYYLPARIVEGRAVTLGITSLCSSRRHFVFRFTSIHFHCIMLNN